MNRRRGNPEVAFQIRFSGGLAVDFGVVVDERQILTLFCGERRCNGWIEIRGGIYADRERIFAKTVIDADGEN